MRSLGLSFGFCALLTVGLLGGCSSDNGSPVDAGKKDGPTSSGGKSGTGGKSGSGGSASGGAVGSGGETGSGGASGAAGAGGASATGGDSATGGAVGTGGVASTGGTVGTGGTTALDGGTGGSTGTDGAIGDDAIDAPLPNPDTPIGDDAADAIIPVLLDGAIDTTPMDAGHDTVVVLLDGAIDVAADAPVDAAVDTVDALVRLDGSLDAGTCLEQLISGGYASGTAAPCSQCKDTTQTPAYPLETQCKAMVDCLSAHDCDAQNGANNCWINCRNQVNGNQIQTEICVLALVNAACP